jgi:hypothetical protein
MPKQINVQIRVCFAPWLPFVLECFARLCEIGFDLDEDDISMIIQDAIKTEVV